MYVILIFPCLLHVLPIPFKSLYVEGNVYIMKDIIVWLFPSSKQKQSRKPLNTNCSRTCENVQAPSPLRDFFLISVMDLSASTRILKCVFFTYVSLKINLKFNQAIRIWCSLKLHMSRRSSPPPPRTAATLHSLSLRPSYRWITIQMTDWTQLSYISFWWSMYLAQSSTHYFHG
jgi:hypothetical protein